MNIEPVLARHPHAALQLSGGKDSVACLYLLREHLGRIVVYHLNTGDQPPETAEVIRECRKIIPHFVEVRTDSRGWAITNGYPSDIVPTSTTPLGRAIGFGSLPLSDRFACCWSNIMLPMHHRMRRDGMTLLIRGQKIVDMPAVPHRSGQTGEGFEFFYPIEDWTDAKVLAYLRSVGAPISPSYDVLNDGVECLHCTAWWNHRHLDWMRTAHPVEAEWVAKKYIQIKAAIAGQMEPLGEQC